MIELQNISKCCGCYACFSVCPQNCISMMEDNEGFIYPQVDADLCKKCGLCEKSCPQLAKPILSDFISAYAAYSKDTQTREVSSSGGIFSIIAEKVIGEGGVVFGACFDRDFNVVHDYAETIEDISKFRGSKYVQSKIGDTYKTAKSFLNEGRLVLFTGTPCQIGGLKTYLQKDYVNLICQDIVCHGVPSPRIWRKYVKFRESEAASKTRRMFFRSKKHGWKTYSVLFEFSNSTEYVKILSEDFYMRGFLANLYLRPSCYSCAFKDNNYYSDITLADFWGIEKMLPEMNDDKGVSLVITHTFKGEKIFSSLSDKIRVIEVPFDDAVKSNPSYFKSVENNPLRKYAIRDFERMSFDKVIEKYYGESIIAKTRRHLYQYFGG